ncbi:MAG: multiheme c-type cytochrome [Myxococcota bacterium]|nr:multiheme c-type cytochrome [Myxococcota bacterium]
MAIQRSLLVSICALSLALASCSDPVANSSTAAPTQAAHSNEATSKTTKADEHAGHAHAASRTERPLPGFEGYTLDGEHLSIRDLIGKRRLVLFFFNPEVKDARPVAGAIASIAKLQQRQNFQIVGIAVGSNHTTAKSFAGEIGLDFPILDDSNGKITAALRLRSPVMVLAADPEGYMSFGSASFPTEAANAAHLIEADLRERLRLPTAGEATPGDLMARPLAPSFTTPMLDGGEFNLADHAGKPIVLIFFLHTCPHCHHALEFFKAELPKIPEAQRPLLFGVSIVDSPSAVRLALREGGLDYFPVLRDPSEQLRTLYGTFSGVPDIFLIDKQGRIDYRVQGWTDRDPALMRMHTAKIAESKIPMLLSKTGYAGNDVCGTCHELELRSWEYTQHASAFDTLVTHGSDHDAECVSCHVVGFGRNGGFDMEAPVSHLEDVGCETCHGRGGPHLSPNHVTGRNYEPACKSCHNPTHSLGFDYATFRPKISHTAIAAMTPEQRAAMVEGRSKPRDVLPTAADHVGSEVCQSCHTNEYATWAASPHANAMASLEAKGEQANTDCQKCHTTAPGKTGGFPSGAAPADHPDLARVGCESCHGPGGDHVQDATTKLGSIVSLGDKCDSCVILQICGSCHDAVNDPDFEFSVQEHIDRQRHGTIEAGTGKPLDPSAAREARLRSGAANALALEGAPARSATALQ